MSNKEALEAVLKKAAIFCLPRITSEINIRLLAKWLDAEGVICPAGARPLRSKDVWWYTPKPWRKEDEDE